MNMSMTYVEALDYMQALHRFGIKLGNERFQALVDRLGNPHRAFRVVHVAGTKGKGSTTAMAATILRQHGFRTGGYFSPYVFDVRERVQVDGEMISQDDFACLVSRVRPHIDALAATPLGPTTEFELKTAVGFLYFAECAVDYATVEVGIGGRLDATNVVSPVATVITNIGLDHTHILGDTHAKIAAEKAGIIKTGIPCVTAVDEPDALQVIQRVAIDRWAPLVLARPAGTADASVTWRTDQPNGAATGFTVITAQREYPDLTSGLLGAYQQANAACAIAAVEEAGRAGGFDVEPDRVRQALASVSLPGRMQIVQRRPTVLLDGAHNEMAARALAAELARMPHRRLLLVIGMAAGHEPEGVLAALAPLAARVYATRPIWTKGVDAAVIAAAARQYCADVRECAPPLAAAHEALAGAGPEDLVVITGSFYVVGDVRPAELLA